MGNIRNIFLFSDSALIVCGNENESLFGRYVVERAELLLELSRLETDKSDAHHIKQVQDQVFLHRTSFIVSGKGKTLELDANETQYLLKRYREYRQYALHPSFLPVKPERECKLVELQPYGSAKSRGVAVGGVSPNGGHWLALVLSATAAAEVMSAAGVDPRRHANELRQQEEDGLSARCAHGRNRLLYW
ncbi:MAG: hypothetical protein U0487_00345 [Patescibacteria group bacterium]